MRIVCNVFWRTDFLACRCHILILYLPLLFRQMRTLPDINHIFNSNCRGAELTNTNLIRRVEERKEKEEEILMNIKKKMERLKLRQERLHQKSTINSEDHFIGK